MRTVPRRTATDVRIRVIADQLTVNGRLVYDSREPLTVKMLINYDVPHASATWRFARDLLAQGLAEPVGMGDVRIWPDGGRVIVSLHGESFDGSYRWGNLMLRRAHVRKFLTDAYGLVPVGREVDYLNLDVELAELLSETGEVDL